jgi:hypothetical protein
VSRGASGMSGTMATSLWHVRSLRESRRPVGNVHLSCVDAGGRRGHRGGAIPGRPADELASAEREAWEVEGGVGWDGTTLQPADRR